MTNHLSFGYRRWLQGSVPFLLLTFFLIIVVFTGGASRADVKSLVVLQPLSIFVCAVAILTLTVNDFKRNRWLLLGFGAIAATTALHLIPLPSAIWNGLSGRDLVAEIDQLTNQDGMYRSSTISPGSSWQALVSLFTPLAVLLLGIQLNSIDRNRVLKIMIGIGVLSVILGIFQSIGGMGGSLYLYRITNNGAAVGLFANRNNAALLLACLIPMLVVFASSQRGQADERRRRRMFAIAIGIVVLPLILVTGSRSGLFVSVLSLLFSAFLYTRIVKENAETAGDVKSSPGKGVVLAVFVIISLGLVTSYFARAEALDRFFEEAMEKDNRNKFWPISTQMIPTYFYLGSGPGSFSEAYQVATPLELLNEYYLNRAHNDWIETAVTLGLMGVIVLVIGIYFFLSRAALLWGFHPGQSLKLARMGSIGIALIAISSISDYPLRTPTMMSILVIFILWFVEPSRASIRGQRQSN